MADAPERMTLQPCPTYGWDHPDRVKHVVGYAAEYVRADITPPAAVVEAMERALRHADQVSRDLGWHRIYDETGAALAALTAWRDSQRPPSEYEQKLSAMKKDFPNGI